ncbi:SDR family NAD(P)-dependent oxidoreductase [Saccharopolyspora sp. K220]|uniref:SDR family NAD(P)-dependent oxidoreductase n=1 Tax=Saccharopolyspora soli TaxID=2926618 RepID=UPI001F5739B7|nr:SDR family NAD(P)-dependent oxidoreductase [Saccharopolyspora soli]MCI2420876.1 SDR family NAD(P)-dependent oxidoreductase [Saccharopolyspora soli]
MREQRAVVTGATSGIGEAIARSLAAAGMTVVMVGRSGQRLDDARERILAAVPDANLHLERADLSLLGEVRELAGRLSRDPLPDIVVSNAAVVAELDDITPEGIQRTLATNHLAPYLLLRLLIGPVGSRPARFVVVGASPRGLTRVPVDLADLNYQTGHGLGPLPSFRPFAAYGRTKNMNAMFVYALARRLDGTRITVNGAHPGIIKGTGLGRDSRGALKLFGAALSLFTPGPDAGADTPVWLATSPEVDGATGRFFVNRKQVPTAPHTTDVHRCDRLWNESARLVGLPPEL